MFYNNAPGVEKCEECPLGEYQATPGHTYCGYCPIGTTTAIKGSDTVANCTGKWRPHDRV